MDFLGGVEFGNDDVVFVFADGTDMVLVDVVGAVASEQAVACAELFDVLHRVAKDELAELVLFHIEDVYVVFLG